MNGGTLSTHQRPAGVNNNLTTLNIGLIAVFAEAIMSSNKKGDRFIFREKRSPRRGTLKQLKIREILSHGVRYGNYAIEVRLRFQHEGTDAKPDRSKQPIEKRSGVGGGTVTLLHVMHTFVERIYDFYVLSSKLGVLQ